YNTVKKDGADMVFGKFSPEGIPQWTSYYGGHGHEEIFDLQINKYQHIFACGYTDSPEFPIYNDTIQQSFGNYENAAIIVFNQDGRITKSGYFGGANNDRASALSIWNDSIIYFTGKTESSDFPTTPGAYQPNLGGVWDIDGFIAVFNGRSWFNITAIPDDTLSINRYSEKNFVIYPNPSRDYLYISGLNDSSLSKSFAQVYDFNGNKIMEERFISTGKKNSINISELPKGLYFLRIISEENSKSNINNFKFIKN
ncbi:MAG: T9SS type A sorting domain-containing protein, partial [Bacteroidetes bacterium]|nr:T9SS type A sorting domain-containing protein [Bacteroidota bacterium]